MFVLHVILPIVVLELHVQAYIYQCLDGCQCDTDDEAIHCHNGGRTTLFLPENRLRGFSVIGVTNNAINRLPPEADLKQKFPDLRAIDVEGNENFDCDSLKDYKTINVYSNCEGEDKPIIIRGQRLPDIEQPTDTCNFECQVKKHYKILHDYLVRIWKMLKTTYEEMDKEKIIKDVQDFFIKLANKVNRNLDGTCNCGFLMVILSNPQRDYRHQIQQNLKAKNEREKGGTKPPLTEIRPMRWPPTTSVNFIAGF